MPNTRNKNYRKGLWSEFLAANLLRLKGYQIIKQRHRSHFGEIDLIAKPFASNLDRFKKIHFIEVKARYNFEQAQNALTYTQQQRIGQSALQWLSHYPQFSDFDISFDMILVVPKRLPRHIPNAFLYNEF